MPLAPKPAEPVEVSALTSPLVTTVTSPLEVPRKPEKAATPAAPWLVTWPT